MRKLYNSKGLKKYVLSIRKDFAKHPEKYPKLEDTPTPPAVRKCSCCASTPTTEAKGFHCPHCPLATTPPPSVGIREGIEIELRRILLIGADTTLSNVEKSNRFIQAKRKIFSLLREQGVPAKFEVNGSEKFPRETREAGWNAAIDEFERRLA